jgi:hypothetical protein
MNLTAGFLLGIYISLMAKHPFASDAIAQHPSKGTQSVIPLSASTATQTSSSLGLQSSQGFMDYEPTCVTSTFYLEHPLLAYARRGRLKTPINHRL